MTTDPTPRSPGPAFMRRRLARRISPAMTLALLSGGWVIAAQAPSSVLDAFDFSKDGGVQEKLPRSLEEISGLTVTAGGRVLAHDDERAVIYELDPATGSVLKAFSAGIGGVAGDFEGIAAVEERLFLVTSAGELLETTEGEDGSALSYRVHETNLGRFCEIEGLAFDPGSRSLLLPCKVTRARELKDHLVVFSVELDSMRTTAVPRVFLPLEVLKELDLKDSFHPSGIEVHPETGRLILISAQEEAILELSPQGALLAGRELHRKTHPQPEGITFLADGSLLLADEGQGKKGRVTRYSAGAPEGEGRP
jgi:uncharacterized protein YjiK